MSQVRSMRGSMIFLLVGTAAFAGRLPVAVAEGAAPGGPLVDPCALLSAADAQKITKIPMRLKESGNPKKMCTYEAANTAQGVNTYVGVELLEPKEWTYVRAGISGKLETDGMKGIGDESYFVRIAGRKRMSDTLLFFVRKGSKQFSVRFVDRGTEPAPAMKDLVKKIADKI